MSVMDQKRLFREGTKRGDFAAYICEPFFPDHEKMLKAAVSQGYSDAKRTFTDIASFWHPGKDKDNFFSFTAGKIRDLFNRPQQDFDHWHQNTCRELCKWFDSYQVTYGQAQKIVNMAFKYLYCLEGAENYSAVFDRCHMPLDSFTLEWYKRYVYKAQRGMVRITDQIKWSKLTEQQYLDIMKAIKEYLQTGPKFYRCSQEMELTEKQLDSELYIWPEMQMHLSVESFLFAFERMSPSQKQDCKKKTVPDKLKLVQQSLEHYLQKQPQ